MKRKQKTKLMKRLLLSTVTLLLLFTGIPVSITAQQVTPTVIGSAGETFSNGEVSLTFSIGEPATETLTEGGITITQGFLQGLSGKIGIEENSSKEQLFTIYPNPVTETLFLRINDKSPRGFYVIKNLQGKILYRGIISGILSAIPVNNYAPGLYLVSVHLNDKLFVNKLFIKQ